MYLVPLFSGNRIGKHLIQGPDNKTKMHFWLAMGGDVRNLSKQKGTYVVHEQHPSFYKLHTVHILLLYTWILYVRTITK